MTDLSLSHRCTASVAGVLADALQQDLAVSPFLVASEPGLAASSNLARLADLYQLDFLSVPADLVEDPDCYLAISAALDHGLSTGKPALFLIECDEDRHHAVAKMLRKIVDGARREVIIGIKCAPQMICKAYATIEASLGVHAALVPTTILSARPAEKSIPIIGTAMLDGSRIMERYLEISIEAPYDHTVRLTVEATSDQADDDQLTEALDPYLNAEIAVRATVRDGALFATTRDFTILDAGRTDRS